MRVADPNHPCGGLYVAPPEITLATMHGTFACLEKEVQIQEYALACKLRDGGNGIEAARLHLAQGKQCLLVGLAFESFQASNL